MTDPVICSHGYSCERSAMLKHLKSGVDTCPLTDMPISAMDFFTNNALRTAIMKWQIHHGGDIRLFSDMTAVYQDPESDDASEDESEAVPIVIDADNGREDEAEVQKQDSEPDSQAAEEQLKEGLVVNEAMNSSVHTKTESHVHRPSFSAKVMAVFHHKKHHAVAA